MGDLGDVKVVVGVFEGLGDVVGYGVEVFVVKVLNGDVV